MDKLLDPIPVKVIKPDEFGHRWFYGVKGLAYAASRGTFTWLAFLAVDDQNATIVDRRWRKTFGQPFTFVPCGIDGHRAIQGGFAAGALKALDRHADGLGVRLNAGILKRRDYQNVLAFLDNLDMRSAQRVELVGTDPQGQAASFVPWRDSQRGWVLKYDEYRAGKWLERLITAEELRQQCDIRNFFVTDLLVPKPRRVLFAGSLTKAATQAS